MLALLIAAYVFWRIARVGLATTVPKALASVLPDFTLSYAIGYDMARDLAIEAYEAADPKIRTDFDNLTASMTSILTAVGAAMREAQQDKTRATLAEQAAAWVKPLVALAGGVINGNSDTNVEAIISNH